MANTKHTVDIDIEIKKLNKLKRLERELNKLEKESAEVSKEIASITTGARGAAKGMDKYGNSVEKAAKKSDKSATPMKNLGKNLGKIKGGALAAAAAISAIAIAVDKAVDYVSRLGILADIAGVGVEEFQSLAYATEQFGFTAEKTADVMKDINDKFGDFFQTGAGPLADFFENIAPKVGVTAKQFARLSGPDALQLYVNSLQKAGVSQKEMTFYLEALGSDLTALIPLLQNGGQELDRLTKKFEESGAAIDEDLVEKARAAREELSLFKTEISNNSVIALADLVKWLNETGKAFVEAEERASNWLSTIGNLGRTEAIDPLEFDVLENNGKLSEQVDEAESKLTELYTSLAEFERKANEGVAPRFGESDGFAAEIAKTKKLIAEYEEIYTTGFDKLDAARKQFAEATNQEYETPDRFVEDPFAATVAANDAMSKYASSRTEAGLAYKELLELQELVNKKAQYMLSNDKDLVNTEGTSRAVAKLDEASNKITEINNLLADTNLKPHLATRLEKLKVALEEQQDLWLAVRQGIDEYGSAFGQLILDVDQAEQGIEEASAEMDRLSQLLAETEDPEAVKIIEAAMLQLQTETLEAMISLRELYALAGDESGLAAISGRIKALREEIVMSQPVAPAGGNTGSTAPSISTGGGGLASQKPTYDNFYKEFIKDAERANQEQEWLKRAQDELNASFQRGEIDVETYKRALTSIEGQMEETKDEAYSLADGIEASLLRGVDSFEDALVDAFFEGENAAEAFKNVFKQIAKDIARSIIKKYITEPLRDSFEKAFDGANSSSGMQMGGGKGGGGGMMQNAGGKGMSAGGKMGGGGGPQVAGSFANGGHIPSGQWGLVGEQGPEFIKGGASGSNIIPMHKAQMSGAGGGGGTTITNVYVKPESMDPEMEASIIERRKDQIVAAVSEAQVRKGNNPTQ